MAQRFRWSKDGGTTWNYVEGNPTLPYNLSSVVSTDIVIVDAIGDDVSAVPAGYSNFTGSNLSQFQAAQAAKNAGTRNSVILPYGDSTVAGVGAGTGTYGVTHAKVGSWPKLLAGLMSGGSASNVFGDNYVSLDAGETVYTFDPSVTGNWTVGTAQTIGFYLNTTVINNTLSWTPSNQVNTLEIGWLTYPGTGTMTIKDEANNVLATLNENAAAALQKTIVSLALGTHTFTATYTTGGSNVNLGYFRAYNSASKETSVLTAGCAGKNSTQLAATTSVWSPINVLKFLAPDLTLIEGGVVNDWLQSIALATSLSNLQAQVTAAKLSGSAILVSPPVSASTSSPYATQAQYVAQMKSLAYSNNIPFIDVWNGVFGGTYQAALMFDDKHCNTAGYTAIASYIKPALAAGFLAA